MCYLCQGCRVSILISTKINNDISYSNSIYKEELSNDTTVPFDVAFVDLRKDGILIEM